MRTYLSSFTCPIWVSRCVTWRSGPSCALCIMELMNLRADDVLKKTSGYFRDCNWESTCLSRFDAMYLAFGRVVALLSRGHGCSVLDSPAAAAAAARLVSWTCTNQTRNVATWWREFRYRNFKKTHSVR